MYATNKVCAHTIPMAETTGKLEDFMMWLVKQKCFPNLSKLDGLQKGAGEKGGILKTTWRKKQTKAVKTTVVNCLSFDRLKVPSSQEACFMPIQNN